MKLYFLTAILAISFTLGNSQTIHKGWIDGQIYFKLKNNSSKIPNDKERVNPGDFPFMNELEQKYNITRLTKTFWFSKDLNLLNTYLLEFSDYSNVDNIIRDLQAEGAIEYAEMAPLAVPCYTPNDPMFNAQQAWHLMKIHAQQAWDYSRGNPKIIIAIVDDGFAFHPDLTPNFWVSPGEIAGDGIDNNSNGLTDELYGYDVADGDGDPIAPSNWVCHGNFVAGLASARTDNGIDIASIGDNASLMLVKCSADGNFLSYAYQGVAWATTYGANVINMSWKFTGPTTTQQNIMTNAYNNGVVLVAAAGNSGTEVMNYPASYAEVIGVAATDTSDKKCNFSDYSTAIDVSAPGMGLYTTLTSNVTTGPYYGTSFCTPIVSGLAALMLSLDSTLTPAQVINCIKSTADNIDALNPAYAGKIGAGRINAEAAMACVAGSVTGSSTNYNNAEAPLVFPNPTSGSITVSAKYERASNLSVIVRNVLGETIFHLTKENTYGGKFQMDFSGNPNGVYFIEVTGGKKTSFYKICLSK
jgi:serine protease